DLGGRRVRCGRLGRRRRADLGHRGSGRCRGGGCRGGDAADRRGRLPVPARVLGRLLVTGGGRGRGDRRRGDRGRGRRGGRRGLGTGRRGGDPGRGDLGGGTVPGRGRSHRRQRNGDRHHGSDQGRERDRVGRRGLLGRGGGVEDGLRRRGARGVTRERGHG